MPTYQYACAHCGNGWDIYCPVKDHQRERRCQCGEIARQVISAPYVTPDIQPYRAVAGDMAGKPITSRREHREFLKRNNLIEVGNEPIKRRKEIPLPTVHEDIKRAIAEVKSR